LTQIYGLEEFDNYLKSDYGLAQDIEYVFVKGAKTNKFNVTLPTYIRNLIHHPENGQNKKFTQTELERSIKYLLKIRKALKP